MEHDLVYQIMYSYILILLYMQHNKITSFMKVLHVVGACIKITNLREK